MKKGHLTRMPEVLKAYMRAHMQPGAAQTSRRHHQS
jgi:hypothetical protein